MGSTVSLRTALCHWQPALCFRNKLAGNCGRRVPLQIAFISQTTQVHLPEKNWFFFAPPFLFSLGTSHRWEGDNLQVINKQNDCFSSQKMLILSFPSWNTHIYTWSWSVLTINVTDLLSWTIPTLPSLVPYTTSSPSSPAKQFVELAFNIYPHL